MKICILSSFEDSLARDTGYSVRIYSLARGLAKLGNKVYVIIPGYRQFKKEIDGLNVHGLKGILPKRLLKLFSRIIGVDKSTSLYFYDPVFIFKVCRIIRQVDVIQIEQQTSGVLFAPIITRICKKALIADCHDVFQALRVKNTGKIRRILETFFETITYRFVDLIVTVSEEEKKLLVNYGIRKDKIKVVPNGVDTEYFNISINTSHIKSQYSLQNSHVVVFVGNMEYPPNKEAVKLIATKIAPLVCREIDGVKFVIVGRYVRKINSPDLVFTGVVGDVVELLTISDVAIAPLFHGSGTRLKILEYLSCGLPVVSTSKGAEGLNLKSGRDIIIKDDLGDFAKSIVMLLKNPQYSQKLRENARKSVLDYDWKKISVKLHKIYKEFLQIESR